VTSVSRDRLLLVAGRVALTLAGAVALAFIGFQYARIVAKNVAIARDLAQTRADIAALETRERAQLRTIARLDTPAGAVPEIHEKLQYVGPHEELIYVRGLPAPTPQPDAEDAP
jgi:hypothetical protein